MSGGHLAFLDVIDRVSLYTVSPGWRGQMRDPMLWLQLNIPKRVHTQIDTQIDEMSFAKLFAMKPISATLTKLEM